LQELTTFEQKGTPVAPGCVRTYREVAEVFGVNTRTVQTWKNDGMPAEDDGTYNLVKIQEWKHNKDGPGRKTGNKKNGSENDYEDRYRKAKAEQAELDLDERKGLLLKAEDVRAAAFNKGKFVKTSLMNLPNKFASVLAAEKDPAAVKKILKSEVQRILGELASDS
jgi:phage terminase Nu1 subunit (DNA packaging protein)